MKSLPVKSWKVLMLLSIVVPVGLLASFRLTGILPSPEEPIVITETTTLNATKWEFERMGDIVHMGDIIENSYNEDGLSAVFNVYVGDYWRNPSAYGSNDCLHLIANVSAFSTVGYMVGLNLFLRDNLYDSRIDIFESSIFFIAENLSIVHLEDWAREAYINFTGVNKPGGIYFWEPIQWILCSSTNQTHEMDAFFEITYFNGTVYKRVVQPFQLRLIGNDDNDSFETADEIGFGSVKAYADDAFGDPEDYYKIWLEEGQVVQAELLQPFHDKITNPDYIEEEPWRYYNSHLNLYVYNPLRELVAYSVHRYDAWVRQVTSTIDSTGWWYIKVESLYNPGEGIYVLNVTPLST